MEFAELIASPKLDGVILHSPFHDPVDGTLCVTGHHLILSSRKEDVQELWLLHQCIDSVEKKPTNSTQNNGGSIVLKCKDFRIIQLDISNTEEFLNVCASIDRLSNLDRAESLYPFFYRPMYNILEDGYTLFPLESEYAKLLAGEEWRLSYVNKSYSVCPTYGPIIIVPKCIEDEVLIASANFRDGGRFPILSYRHDNGAILMRSSQPMLCNSNRRSRADEKILNVILGSSGKKGFIIDTRSPSYVSQCKGKGGGTEPDAHYTHWKRVHKPLDKIVKCDGSLLDNLAKLMDACNDTSCSPDKWLSRLESSNWLSHIQNVLNASCLVAQCLDQDGVSVLVHGSTGFDSTLLITSLSQVILNPDCRTVRGLQALIQREWLQAGYPFQLRHQKSCYSNNSMRNKCQQPTFLLFLDCIHQLHYQFPCTFEFQLQMLILIFEHSYFSQFGTFLGNCEADREQMKLSKKTTSLWSYMNRPDVLTSLLNPIYEPNKLPIWPSVAPVSLVLWSGLYLRWVISQQEYKKLNIKIQNIIDYDKNLKSKTIKLRKELIELQKEYNILSIDDESDN